ncbi:MAG: STM4015 family protein [Scytonematopsis contorta HA4267-MV1]|jgi:hypothetical protein|nr:STM4015 family protein [Scytonematopsis contorta HA4267-MV1]
MANNENHPRDFDAVLGKEAPFLDNAGVLGGIEGIKRWLSNPVSKVRVAALSEALKYDDAGLDVVIQALWNESKVVQRFAYSLLRKREESKVKQALSVYKPWFLEERLTDKYPSTFANRKKVDFDVDSGITDPVGNAYALGSSYDSDDGEADVTEKLAQLLQDPQAVNLEALIIGMWNSPYDESSSGIINALVEAKNKLTNLKAVFIGDMTYEDCEISWIQQSDISPILQAYPKLEVLQVRGGEGLKFSPPIRHNSLKALIVETGGLGRDTVAQICNLKLPALEHLELWFGSEDYGGNCWVECLKPILEDIIFPNLNYLGLRNSMFSDEIADAVVRSTLIDSISVLDLSMGTLGDEGAEILLDCSAVNNLDILNVDDNYLSEIIIGKLKRLEAQVIAGEQKEEDDDSYIHSRYCSVAE